MSVKVGMISLGCAKNQVDAEVMLGMLRDSGMEITNNAEEADVVIINTCGFIETAKTESIDNILEIIELKKEGKIRSVIVTGCLSERYQKEISAELPEVDAFLGTGSYDEIVNAVDITLKGENYTSFKDKNKGIFNGKRVLTTPPYTSYLKIAEGCDNWCSYCAIPLIRGRYRSRPIEELLDEAETLSKNGVTELCIIAQDTTRYGEDLYGRLMLPQLLKKLCTIEGLRWIRILYCYPERITDELIDVIANEPKIVKYLDIPLQHISTEILKKMNRQGDKESITALLCKIRQKVPNIVLRTTFIVGFPGETEKEFEELVTFIKDMEFERLGVFAYSREEGTKAALLENHLSENEKEHRQDIIMQEQMYITGRYNESLIGKTLEAVVEGYDRLIPCYYGRTAADAPEIDTQIFFISEKPLTPGQYINVKITDMVDYDILGEAVTDLEE